MITEDEKQVENPTTDDGKLKRFNTWVAEAQWASRDWRSESWRDCEMMDGGDSQWSQDDWDRAVAAGIDPLTVNRVFPVINSILGGQVIDRFETIAKGRTQKDGEISQVMSEGIRFVFDQCDGEFLLSAGFWDAIVPGFGCIAPVLNHDPRKERVTLKYRDWKEVWWDPFSSPWWTSDGTRYVFWQRWIDLDDLLAIWPEKEKEIRAAYRELCHTADWSARPYSGLQDEAQLIEEEIRSLSASDWVDPIRKRVRPVEMYYPRTERCLYGLFADGRCIEIRDDMPANEQFAIVEAAYQVVKAAVKKMQVASFFSDRVMLQDQPTPYAHDEYPLVPMVGYIDRYRMPYGVPRQIRGQQEEVNRRRSMALALLQKRRLIAERGAVPGGDRDELDALWQEANKIDGFLVVADGKIQSVKLDEHQQLLAGQVELLRQSEMEIREVTGVNAEAQGMKSGAESGVAKQLMIGRSQVMTATLLDNLRRSMKLIGDQIVANIQKEWTGPKVLRITDRLTGAERFVALNDPVIGKDGAVIEVKNNITQGRYDIEVSEAPITDTTREKYLDLLYSAIQKAPPEAVPVLLVAAFEISDLPNKDTLIEKLKPVLGVEPGEEDLTPEQQKQKALEAIEAQRQEAAQAKELQMAGMRLELKKVQIQNAELEAKIAKLRAETAEIRAGIVLDERKQAVEEDQAKIGAFEKGMDVADRLTGRDQDKEKARQ